MPLYRSHILVCGGTGCTSGGSDKIYDAFLKEIEAQNLKDEVQVIRTGCFGLCAEGTNCDCLSRRSFLQQGCRL